MLLFYFKRSFRSQDIKIFVLTFWSCRKNGSIRVTITITIHILHNISQSKGSQKMKFDQLR